MTSPTTPDPIDAGREGLRKALDTIANMPARLTAHQLVDQHIEMRIVARNALDAKHAVPEIRCDACDNGIEKEWPFCAWCGYGGDLAPTSHALMLAALVEAEWHLVWNTDEFCRDKPQRSTKDCLAQIRAAIDAGRRK